MTGPIVLVGHADGGNLSSMAAVGNDQLRALGSVNGWRCDQGERQPQLLDGSKAAS